jgi:hypothetical protein
MKPAASVARDTLYPRKTSGNVAHRPNEATHLALSCDPQDSGQIWYSVFAGRAKGAAECRLISDLATDAAKRELFDRLASHLIVLADQVGQEMLKRKPMSS